jgi:hypothetical protein
MRRLLFLIGILIACSFPVEAQTVSTLIVNAPRAILTSGENMRLRAGARDAQGNRVIGGTYQWTSSNTAVATIDASGAVSARGVGITNIAVRSGNVVSPNMTLQVIPLRIDIVPNTREVLVGQTIQFSATLVDVNEQPIPNINVAWSITGETGFATRAATINNQGLFTAQGATIVTVHAAINFAGQSSAQLARFENMAQVLIKAPVDYKLTRWLATNPMERTFTIRPGYMSEISVNDSGQVAVVANLEGLSSALMLYQNGRFDVLASTGMPGSRPATYIYHFEAPPTINDAGQVAVRYGALGEAGLLIASKDGVALLPEGFSLGSLQRLNFFRVSRYSLNNNGDIVFLASFTVEGTRTFSTGLFRASNGNVSLIWSGTDALAGFPASYFFDTRDFGQDAEGNVYFTVQSGTARAIYKASDTGGIERIAGPGASFGGYVIQAVSRLVLSADGYLAFTATLQGGGPAVVRLRLSDSRSEALTVNGTSVLLGVSDSGDVLWTGDPGPSGGNRGWGIWQWPGTGTLAQLIQSGITIGGGTFSWARSGGITSKGEPFADISTGNSDLLVVQPGTNSVLFREGATVKAAVALNLQGIVPGSSDGPLHIFTGSGNMALMQAAPGDLKPVWIPGDRIGGLTSSIAYFAVKDSAGTLYVAVGNGIMRYGSNRFEPLLTFPIPFPFQAGEPVTLTGNATWYIGSQAFAANRTGTFVWNASAGTHNRLMLYDRGNLTTLMAQGGANQTSSPGGGKFSGVANGNWHQTTVAMDERGRVFVNANVSGGPSGLFLYDNGRWNTAALFGTTRIAGETVLGSSAIQAGEDRFYAVLDLSGGRALVEYDGQQWKVLVSRTDMTPDGMDVGSFGNLLSVNRRGGVAFQATGNRPRLVTRTADGKLHIVYSALDQTASGDSLWPFTYFSLQYYDDGRVFIAGLDTLDRNTIYVAEPTF